MENIEIGIFSGWQNASANGLWIMSKFMSLQGLEWVTNIDGVLTILGTSMLTSLHGLEGSTNIVGHLVFDGNDGLASL